VTAGRRPDPHNEGVWTALVVAVVVVALGLTVLGVIRRSTAASGRTDAGGNPYADDRWEGGSGHGSEWGPGP
jgi:hypothetical protein